MTFAWTYIDGTGEEVGGSHDFADTESAEEWLSTAWRDLYESGVEEVALHDRDRGRRMYRMGLGEE